MNETILKLVADVATLTARVSIIWQMLLIVLTTSAGALITNFIQIAWIKKNGFGYCAPRRRRK